MFAQVIILLTWPIISGSWLLGLWSICGALLCPVQWALLVQCWLSAGYTAPLNQGKGGTVL